MLLTFGQRIPAGSIGDPLVKEIPAVPPVVHPTVSVRVGPCQLSSHTNPHAPLQFTCFSHTQAESHMCSASGSLKKEQQKSVHLSEEFVVRSGRVHGPPSNARISRPVEGIISYDGASVQVG